MTEWQVFLTEQAEADLRGIYEYIASTLLVPDTAKKFISRIMASIFELRTLPESYSLYQKEPWRSRGLRRMNTLGYAVFFVAAKSEQAVVVLRIMYGGRNIDHILEEAPEA